MTSELFLEWLREINRRMTYAKRKILIFLDNAPCHPCTQLSNVKLQFFPPNCTSHLQPLDQGVIRAFIVRYRKLLLERLLASLATVQRASELVKTVTVLDSVHWIGKAWSDIECGTVVNCFRKARFCTEIRPIDSVVDDSVVTSNDLQSIARITGIYDINETDIDAMDSDLPVTANFTFMDWEKDLLCDFLQECKRDNELDDAEDNEDHEEIITSSEFETYLQKMKAYVVRKQPQMLRQLQQLQSAFDESCYTDIGTRRQTRLERFFS